MIDPETILRQSSDALGVELDGEHVVMHAGSGAFYGLRNTAVDIWQRLDGKTSVGQIKLKMSEDYGVDPAVCGPAIDTFIAALIKAELAAAV